MLIHMCSQGAMLDALLVYLRKKWPNLTFSVQESNGWMEVMCDTPPPIVNAVAIAFCEGYRCGRM